MSSNTNPLSEEIRAGPQHHLHSDNEPLPGSKGGATTVDYTPETIDETRLPPSEEGTTQDLTYHHRHRDNSNMPQQSGGETMKPGMTDKVIGKAQEIVGKVTNNPPLQEKGAERAHPKATA